MGKNILIFADGTGNVGGLRPDEERTNVYKLYRATRCGPDSTINPSLQVAFYDPGIGTGAAQGRVRQLINILCQMTGLGITRNIIDCYAAIIDLWKPKDRIYLFGFSRGAYTARCVGGVLKHCGVPRKGPKGERLASPSAIKEVAREAVKKVYQHGASKHQERFEKQREDLAKTFRQKYDSEENGESNAVPYFIGVWDTVAALGMTVPRLILAYLIALPLLTCLLLSIAWVITHYAEWLPQTLAAWAPWLFSYWTPFGSAPLVPVLKLLLYLCLFGLAVSYLWTHVKWATGTRDRLYKTFHIVFWRLKFYDKNLNDRVGFARHAISIDESRQSFPRVSWKNAEGVHPRKEGEMNWFEQIWFAGNHGDIGGGYHENESRLSDIALKWIADEARRVPYPIIVNENYLQMFPSSAGMMHDERRRSRIPWFEKLRTVPDGAHLHKTVFERLAMEEVRNYDMLGKYAPKSLETKTFHRYDPVQLNASGSQPKANKEK